MCIEHIRNAIGAYQRNFLELFAASLFIALIGSFASYFGAQFSGPSDFSSMYMLLLFSPFVVILTAVSVIVSAGIVKMCAESLKGRTDLHTLQATFNAKWRTILFANVLVILIAFATLVPVLLLAAVPLGLYLGVAVWLLFIILFSFVDQAIVISNKKAIESVYFSFNMAKKKYVQILLLFAVLGLVFVLPMILLNRYELLQTFFSTLVSPLVTLSITSLYLSKK